MKKTHKHDELSTKVCDHPGCTKRIKKRLEATNDKCFLHHCVQAKGRGRFIGPFGRPRSARVLAGLPVKMCREV